MVSRTHIKSRKDAKSNTQLRDTIVAALKTKSKVWHAVAQRLSASTRQYDSINLSRIEANTTAGDTVIILGKVLSAGQVTKKVRVCALGFSEGARDKLKKTKSETVSVLDEISKNSKAEGVKIL